MLSLDVVGRVRLNKDGKGGQLDWKFADVAADAKTAPKVASTDIEIQPKVAGVGSKFDTEKYAKELVSRGVVHATRLPFSRSDLQ